MTISVFILLYLFTAHFVGDFTLQSNEMAQKKSEDLWILMKHSLLYSLPFWGLGFQYMLFVICSHFSIDYVTSKFTKKYWQKEDKHEFFLILGLDQLLHYSTLVGIYCLVFL